MDLIMQKMKDLEYDKYHKPNPSGKLDVSTNMFIDSIQGIVSKVLDFTLINALRSIFEPVGPFLSQSDHF